MDISVIIVNYNTTDLVRQCIHSIYDKTQGVSFEIIVVDNDSPDKSIDSITLDFPHILLVKSAENLGFGKANNLGAKHAKGDYLFFLNPDTLLINNAIYILYKYLKDNPQVGICGGNLFDANLNKNGSYSLFFPSIKDEIDILLGGLLRKLSHDTSFNRTQTPIPVAFVSGADMFISKYLFNEVEGFSPDFFMYFEETELTFRIKRKGYRIVNVPQAEIVHLEGRSFTVNSKRIQAYCEGRNVFFTKCYSRKYVFFANSIFRLTCLTRLFIYKIFNTQKYEYWKSLTYIFNQTNE